MATDLQVSTDEFDAKVLKATEPVLVDFWAEWCGPCKMIGPSVEALASEYAGKAKVYKLDVDQNQDVAVRYGVHSIPTLLVFKGGKVVERGVGSMPKPAIAALIERAL